jgi:hypothetical protein
MSALCGCAGTPTDTGSITVLYGDLSGTEFSSNSDIDANFPRDLASADVDGNGLPDLAFAEQDGIAVALQDAPRQYGSTVLVLPLPAPGASSIRAADLDGDPNVDLVVGTFGGAVHVLYGLGDGTFLDSVPYLGPGTRSVIILDVSGDGRNDIAVSNFGDATVTILENVGPRTFSVLRQSSASGPYALAAGDFNNDGSTDIACVAVDPANAVSLLVGDGNGMFAVGASIDVGRPLYTLAVADVDGDENLDVLASGNGPKLFLGDGHGALNAGPQLPTAIGGAYAVALHDLDGDGTQDLVATFPHGQAQCAGCGLGVFKGSGRGQFDAVRSLPVGEQPIALDVVDLDGDGVSDIGVANSAGNTGL